MATEFRSRFVSRAPREKSLKEAGLILTATREERAQLALVNPTLRDRTFTLKEAVNLGTDEISEDELELASASEGLHGYAVILHERRGLRSLPTAPRRRFVRKTEDPFDIPDVHHSVPRLHRAGLEDVRDTTRELYARIFNYLSVRAAD